MKTPIQVGKYLKELIDARGYSQSDLAEKMVEYANQDKASDEYKKDNFKDSISKWLRGVSYPGIDKIYYLSKVLKVSIENILSAGEVDEKYQNQNRVTLYSVANTQDDTLIKKFFDQSPEILKNYDEFDKNLFDYVVEFENYKVLKELIDRDIIHPFFPSIRYFSYVALSNDTYYNKILKILAKNDDVERFIKVYDVFKIVNAADKRILDLQDMKCIKIDEDVLNIIYESENLFKYLIDERVNPNFKEYSCGLVNENLKNLPSLSGMFNTLLMIALQREDKIKAENMLKIGIKHNENVLNEFKKIDFMPYDISKDYCVINRWCCFVNVLAGVPEDIAKNVKDKDSNDLVKKLNNSLKGFYDNVKAVQKWLM